MSDLCKKSVPLPEADLTLTVIDMDHMVVEDMAAACRGLGCFQVINHGIRQSVMDNAVEAASGFFKLPDEAKREFASDDVRQPVRYSTTSSNDGISVSRSSLKLYAHPLREWTQYWPTQPPVYREHMAQYASEARRVALQLMEAILQGLGLGQEYRRAEFEKGLQLLVVNGYPKASDGDTAAIAMAPHSDYAFLTVLLTDCRGLEVLDCGSGSWRAVRQLPSSLHVQVGDHMEVLSNGGVRALVHRAALNPEQPRVSIGSFHGFEMHEKICCAQELVDESNPRRYRDSSFADFLDHLVASRDKEEEDTTTFLQSLRM